MVNLLPLLLLGLTHVAHGYRILAIFPTPSYSHQITYRSVMEKLAESGHTVVVLTPFPSRNPNLTEIDLSFLKSTWQQIDFAGAVDWNYIEFCTTFVQAILTMMDQILSHEDVQPLLRADLQHFDAVICEFLGYTPMYAFARLYRAPLIGMTSLDMFPEQHAAIGNFVHMTLHPNSAFPFYGRLGFWERVGAVYLQTVLYNSYIGYYSRGLDEVTLRHFGPIGTSEELSRDISFAIVNSHPAMDNVRPLLPSTVQVGFLHVKPPEPLPEEFERILQRPTIYLSFGSNVRSSSLKPKTVKTILSVFRELKDFNVIWKLETEKAYETPSNVFMRQWLPQQDLLAHPNVRLFITQGGQQSIEEAIDRLVPMLVIPFFGDQITNAPRVVHLGIGLSLKLNSLREEEFRDVILELVTNSSYRENLVKLREVVRDVPMPPVETAAWWIEYAIRHRGAPHLEYRGAHMPFWEYYLLDVIAFTVFMLATLAVLVRFLLCKLKLFVLRKSKIKTS